LIGVNHARKIETLFEVSESPTGDVAGVCGAWRRASSDEGSISRSDHAARAKRRIDQANRNGVHHSNGQRSSRAPTRRPQPLHPLCSDGRSIGGGCGMAAADRPYRQ
jgi:hypothetical protein